MTIEIAENTMYVLIEGEPFLSKAKAYAEEVAIFASAWDDFAEEYGCCGIAPACNGLLFDGEPPEGWTKREGRSGFSRPKAGTDAAKVMAALPKRPKAWDVFDDGLLYEIVYEEAGKKRVVPVCELWEGPEVSWAGDKFFAQVPDPVAAAAKILAKNPERKIVNSAADWHPPEGLLETSAEMVDRMMMQGIRSLA